MASQAEDVGSSGNETPLKAYVNGDSPDSICCLCNVTFIQLQVFLYLHRLIAGSSKCTAKQMSSLSTKISTVMKTGLEKYYYIFVISQLWLTSNPRSTVVLLDTGSPFISREISSEDADGETRTRNSSVINRVL